MHLEQSLDLLELRNSWSYRVYFYPVWEAATLDQSRIPGNGAIIGHYSHAWIGGFFIVDPAGSATDLEWKTNSNHERWETAIELATDRNTSM
jgi:hypothetical protein